MVSPRGFPGVIPDFEVCPCFKASKRVEISLKKLGLRTFGIGPEDESIDDMFIWIRKFTFFHKNFNFLNK